MKYLSEVINSGLVTCNQKVWTAPEHGGHAKEQLKGWERRRFGRSIKSNGSTGEWEYCWVNLESGNLRKT